MAFFVAKLQDAATQAYDAADKNPTSNVDLASTEDIDNAIRSGAVGLINPTWLLERYRQEGVLPRRQDSGANY